MNWIYYILLSTLLVLPLEMIYRLKIFPSFWHGLWIILPLAIGVQYCLFYGYAQTSHYFLGRYWFFLFNTIITLLACVFILKESINAFKVGGLILIVLGALLMKI